MNPPPELVERYRTRAPRYTSYPAAPHFGPLDPAVYEAALARGSGPISAYVHIPFCRTLCSYCGCHVEIRKDRAMGTAYTDTLLAELDLVVARLGGGRLGGARPVDQLALGGGTPTFLLPADMRRLVDGIRDRLGFTTHADVSIEIDPRTVDNSYLDTLVELGFRRFSFGVQDFSDLVLAGVNRPQPAELVHSAVARLRRHGDFDLNFDLMYGLPHQTEASFGETVAEVAGLRPTRLALFHYAHVPWMKPAQKLVERAGLPEPALKARLFQVAEAGLRAAGYVPVGMDHFALPGDALVAAARDGTLQRNFMGYTTRAGLDQIGLGVSAIGYVSGVYAQDHKERDPWASDVLAGRLPLARGYALSAEDLRRRALIMDLFCNFRARFVVEGYAEEWERLAPLEADGLVRRRDDGLDVTPLGRHFIRNVCSVFDRFLEADPVVRRYSATA